MGPCSSFYEEISQPEEKINLTRAALLHMREEFPNLNMESCFTEIHSLALALEDRFRIQEKRQTLKERIRVISHFIFDEVQFKENNQEPHSVKNYYLHEVIRRKKGSALGLSLIYLQVLHDLSFKASCIDFPGHFLIKVKGPRSVYFVDPVNRGAILKRTDLEQMLKGVFGERMPLQKEYLNELSKKKTLFRLLAHIKAIWMAKENFYKALKVMEKMQMLDSGETTVYRDRGFAYCMMRNYQKAVSDFKQYLKLAPKADDARAVELQMNLLQRAVHDTN